jgi:hypothetical protein
LGNEEGPKGSIYVPNVSKNYEPKVAPSNNNNNSF